MTADTPPHTAVEALRLAQQAIGICTCYTEHPVAEDLYDRTLTAIRQALQLHGGGESRSALPPVAQPDTFSFEAQLAERLRDPEWVSKWNADAEGLRSFQEMLNSLRRKEGDSITLLCDNPDFNGQPNNAVECCGDWTGWQEQRFTGDSLLLAVRAAYVARAGVTTSQQASMGGSELKPEAPTSAENARVDPSNPILQGPTREEVASIIAEHEGFCADTEVFDCNDDVNTVPAWKNYRQHADAILALLNPTSPWRPIESAPVGVGVLVSSPHWDGMIVQHWDDERHKERALAAWLYPPTVWATVPSLPALPGGESGT